MNVFSVEEQRHITRRLVRSIELQDLGPVILHLVLGDSSHLAVLLVKCAHKAPTHPLKEKCWKETTLKFVLLP